MINAGAEVAGARTSAECAKRILRLRMPDGEIAIPLIDSSGQGFAYYPDSMVVSSLAVKRRWKKSEIIDVYNSRKPAGRPEYRAGSLSNKPVERIVFEIVALLCEP